MKLWAEYKINNINFSLILLNSTIDKNNCKQIPKYSGLLQTDYIESIIYWFKRLSKSGLEYFIADLRLYKLTDQLDFGNALKLVDKDEIQASIADLIWVIFQI